MTAREYETGLLLPGGGARAAYQVGVLRAVAHVLGRGGDARFRIICGTSAGAINAAMLAVHADSFRRGVARLLRLWRRIEVDDVYHAGLASLATHGMAWMASVLIGRHGPVRAASMLDNSPLRGLLAGQLDLALIEGHVGSGRLRALGINATSYTTGHAVTFFQGSPKIAPWRRMRRHGEACTLTIDHLLASSAIPFVFPAARVGDDYYADGSVRLIAPLSPALHLGARRVLVIGVGQFNGQQPPHREGGDAPPYPSFAQVAGQALSSIFLDNLGADLERTQQINRLLHLLPHERAMIGADEASHVDVLAVFPSIDIGKLATGYANRLPRGVRYMLRGFGSTQGTGANLLSYLLFDNAYCRALLALGFADAMKRRDEIDAFLAGGRSSFLPLFPPELQ